LKDKTRDLEKEIEKLHDLDIQKSHSIDNLSDRLSITEEAFKQLRHRFYNTYNQATNGIGQGASDQIVVGNLYAHGALRSLMWDYS
jgi:hypothetical protein